MSDGTDTTAQIKTLRDSLKVPVSELEEAVAKHAEAAIAAREAAREVKKEARRRSISPAKGTARLSQPPAKAENGEDK